MPHATAKMKDCIDACVSCFKTCLETIPHCLEMGNEHSEPKHIALLQTCADICNTSARAMLVGAADHAIICGACAEICEACADECESMEGDFMKECADACRKCADSCREMASSVSTKKDKAGAEKTMRM